MASDASWSIEARVDHAAVDLAGERRLGQAGADALRHFGHRDGPGYFATGTVGQRDCDHLAPLVDSAAPASGAWRGA
jgi:hypothetical protein